MLFDSSISVWDVVSMSLACVLQTRGERDANFGHSSGVNGVAITRDGGLVVTVSKDETARVWNVHSGSGEHVLRGALSCFSPACADALQTCTCFCAAQTWSADGQTLSVRCIHQGDCAALHGRASSA